MIDDYMGDNIPTTIGGFCLLAATLLITAFLKSRSEKPRENAKLGNLESIANSMIDSNNINRSIVEQLEKQDKSQKKYAKFGRKQSKKINKKLGSIHEDVILVKQYTYKEKK